MKNAIQEGSTNWGRQVNESFRWLALACIANCVSVLLVTIALVIHMVVTR